MRREESGSIKMNGLAFISLRHSKVCGVYKTGQKGVERKECILKQYYIKVSKLEFCNSEKNK